MLHRKEERIEVRTETKLRRKKHTQSVRSRCPLSPPPRPPCSPCMRVHTCSCAQLSHCSSFLVLPVPPPPPPPPISSLSFLVSLLHNLEAVHNFFCGRLGVGMGLEKKRRGGGKERSTKFCLSLSLYYVLLCMYVLLRLFIFLLHLPCRPFDP